MRPCRGPKAAFATGRTSCRREAAMDVPNPAISAQPPHRSEAIHDSALARERPRQCAECQAHNLRHEVTKRGPVCRTVGIPTALIR